MILAYSFVLRIILCYYFVLSFFNKKVQEGWNGRRGLQDEVTKYYEKLDPNYKRTLVHVSSFGELEQAKPVIAALKKEFHNVHIHLTFFSPSGYLNAKGKYPIPDVITYLPFDTKKNVRRFLDSVKPSVLLIVRYDIWPNLAIEAQKRNVPSILFSATYRPKAFTTTFYRKIYQSLTAIFTIHLDAQKALLDIGVSEERLEVAGDTRVDQVLRRKEDVSMLKDILPEVILQRIQKDSPFVLIAGSSWKEDENMIAPWIKDRSLSKGFFSIIVPHEVTGEHIQDLRSLFGTNAILLSEINSYDGQQILIWDKIGDLFHLYKHASLAYVGGGFGAGVHNVLEPSAWGVPSIVGPRHERSVEVARLIDREAVYSVNDEAGFSKTADSLYNDAMRLKHSGDEAKAYLLENTGATEKIMAYLKKNTSLA